MEDMMRGTVAVVVVVVVVVPAVVLPLLKGVVSREGMGLVRGAATVAPPLT